MNDTAREKANPFFAPYDTLHDTVPFDRITISDYEEAFMEGIRRDDEEIDKIINDPEEPTSILPCFAKRYWNIILATECISKNITATNSD